MPQKVNPYADRRTNEGGAAPGINSGSAVYYSRYAVPGAETSEMAGYTTGYATELDPDYESGTTPDPIRTGAQEPPINDPNNRRYWRRRRSEQHARETQDNWRIGWDVQQQRVPPGQNPLWEQDRPNTRPTQDDSPTGYMFTRGDWYRPRFLGDIDPSINPHVSMADHRRAYEVYGMRGQNKLGTNTFRIDPTPWDQGLYPPDQHRELEHTTGAPPSGGAFRLG